jgi:hypothetical protein
MKLNILSVVLSLLLIVACEDIVETNLETSSVYLVAPPDSYQTTISTHTFWWDEVQDAEGYNLQIVSPSFDYVERLFLDTNIIANKYDFTLLPGEYQWRVRAYNYSTTTPYSTFSLSIDSTIDISQQIIQLLSPSNFDTTNQTQIQFNWGLLYNATDYSFQLYYQQEKILVKNLIYDTLTEQLLQGDGSYIWEVRGQNEFSNTAYSSRQVYIDTTPPNKPNLILPALNASLPDSTINFEWDRGIISGSSIKDSLYIATDLLMTNIIRNVETSALQYSDSLGPGQYYWRVRSKDRAGNRSPYSNIRNFTIETKIGG